MHTTEHAKDIDRRCPSGVPSGAEAPIGAEVPREDDPEEGRFHDSLAKLVEDHRTELLRKYETRVGAKLRARFDADDLLQGALLRCIAERRRKLDSGQSFSWPSSPQERIARIRTKLYSEFIDQMRQQSTSSRNQQQEIPWPDGSVADVAQSMGLTTQDTIKHAVRLIRDKLTPYQFVIIWLRCALDFSWESITEILNELDHTTFTTSKYTKEYARILKKLRDSIPSPFSSSGNPLRS